MKLIKPSEISGKIMTLIEEAEKEIILISPYNKVDQWPELQECIKRAKQKGVQIE